ncbi:MAG: lanthionine synthetase LanC family protein [Bacteroidia bacterium]
MDVHLYKKTQTRLSLITAELDQYLTQDVSKLSISFFEGLSGVIYARSYMKISPKDEIILHKSITDCLKNIENQTSPDFTYASGLTGFCWVINKLNVEGLIPIDTKYFFSDIQPILKKATLHNLKIGNYDLLYGALGYCLFLMELPVDYEFIKDVVCLFKSVAIQYRNSLVWRSYLKPNEIDLGLAHGLVSILYYFNKAYPSAKEENELKLLTINLVDFILSQKNETSTENQSLFPNFINTPATDSRLSWCYGDLGIASVLMQVGKQFDNISWQKEAISIALHSANRKKNTNIRDACFCHGAAGVAHIFNRFFRETNHEKFDLARLYWLEQTLNMAKNGNGLAGYKTWQGENKGFKSEIGLLEGIAGIGLVLQGFLSEDENLNWDSCFLLS